MHLFVELRNQKTWSLQNNVATHIDLIWNVEKSDEENFYEYFLVWEGKEIRGESNKNKIQFANISLQPGTHDFELRRRKTNLIIHSQSFCNNFQIEIEKFNSESTFPIAYKIFDDKQQLLMQGDYQTPITLENLKTSSLYIEVEYAHKKYNKQLDFLSEEWKSLEFQSIYWLGSEPLSFYFEKDDFKRVEWYKENKKFADSYNTLLQEEGTYKVILTNQSDCQKEFSFQVRKACASDTWNIYPNPASVNEWISTEFHWQENKKVDLKIYQEDGKLVKSFPPFYTNHLDVPKFQLTTSGVYIIVAYIDNNLEIKKLIIK